MAPTYLFLLTLSLGVPLYVALRAASLIIPSYSILLMLAILLAWFSWHNPKNLVEDDIILCLILMIASVCGLVGFAMAPLAPQLAIAIGLLLYQRKYWTSLRG